MLSNNIVYHYCSVDTFLSIINSNKIWLSSSLTTNDFLENQLILLKLEKILNEENSKYKENFKRFYEHFRINVTSTFVSCFSENGDLLSQWRAYANDVYGVFNWI